jgi:CBS domain-containing protein
MNIERVYTRPAVWAQRSTSLEVAAGLMRKHHVGALLISEDKARDDLAVGIVTDRDFVVRAVANGVAPREMCVGDIMMPLVASVPADADVHEAIEKMRDGGIRRLAVTGEGGRILGIVSLEDLVDALAAELYDIAGVYRAQREREEKDAKQREQPRRA